MSYNEHSCLSVFCMDIRFYIFWVISRHGVARLCDMCMLNFWRNSETVFLGSWTIYILAALYESSNCSKTSLTLGIASHFYFSHSIRYIQYSSVQSLSCVRLFVTPWIAAHQASLSITNSWSSLRLTSIESVMPSSHLILCRPLLLLPPIPPSIRVFSNESDFCVRWSE